MSSPAAIELPVDMVDVAVAPPHNPAEPLVTDVNWQVQRDEFWLVAGPQQSGKTLLLQLAAGLLRPLQGTCRVFGAELAGERGEEHLPARRRVGVVFDGGGRLFSQLTVQENVSLPLRYCDGADVAAIRTQELLTGLDLDEWRDRRPRSLSRSWCQRVALARALALRPELLLLDNPLRNLDARHLDWWLETLGQLAAGHPALGGRPVTLVAATDELRAWRGIGARHALLQGRRLRLLEGTADNTEAAERLLLEELPVATI